MLLGTPSKNIPEVKIWYKIIGLFQLEEKYHNEKIEKYKKSFYNQQMQEIFLHFYYLCNKMTKRKRRNIWENLCIYIYTVNTAY